MRTSEPSQGRSAGGVVFVGFGLEEDAEDAEDEVLVVAPAVALGVVLGAEAGGAPVGFGSDAAAFFVSSPPPAKSREIRMTSTTTTASTSPRRNQYTLAGRCPTGRSRLLMERTLISALC
jgi:hypothetical protein